MSNFEARKRSIFYESAENATLSVFPSIYDAAVLPASSTAGKAGLFCRNIASARCGGWVSTPPRRALQQDESYEVNDFSPPSGPFELHVTK
jgi:hypothetical protein